MSKRKDGQARGKYTLELKLEAVPVTPKILGLPVQTLGNWVRLSASAPQRLSASAVKANSRAQATSL